MEVLARRAGRFRVPGGEARMPTAAGGRRASWRSGRLRRAASGGTRAARGGTVGLLVEAGRVAGLPAAVVGEAAPVASSTDERGAGEAAAPSSAALGGSSGRQEVQVEHSGEDRAAQGLGGQGWGRLAVSVLLARPPDHLDRVAPRPFLSCKGSSWSLSRVRHSERRRTRKGPFLVALALAPQLEDRRGQSRRSFSPAAAPLRPGPAPSSTAATASCPPRRRRVARGSPRTPRRSSGTCASPLLGTTRGAPPRRSRARPASPARRRRRTA